MEHKTKQAMIGMHVGQSYYECLPEALDKVIAEYLPNSINGLRSIINERVGEELFNDVHDLSILLIVLADFETGHIINLREAERKGH